MSARFGFARQQQQTSRLMALSSADSASEDESWMLPKSKQPRRRVELWPRRRLAFTIWLVITATTLALTVWSAIAYALPGVNELLGPSKAMTPLGVSLDALFGKCITIRAPGERLLSTQSPLLSDIALDADRHDGQHYRLLTYALAHCSVLHVLWDAYVLRSALFAQSTALRLRRPTPLCGNADLMWCVATLGAIFGGIAHRAFYVTPRAVGVAGVAAALHGATFVAQSRLKEPRTKRMAFKNLIIVSVGGAIFGGSPMALCFTGFVVGALFAAVACPKFEPIEPEFALFGDKKEADRRKGKSRAFAPRLAEGLKRYDPPLPPLLVFFLLFAFIPDVHDAFLQLPQALYFATTSPGALSGRTLHVEVTWWQRLFWTPY